jgi:hypothetical protein
MMKKLCLPCPKYESQIVGGCYFSTKIMFYPSAHFLRTSLHLEDALEKTTNQAVAKTIMYIETGAKKFSKISTTLR